MIAVKIMKGFFMNLHEECLLKYLLNPLNLVNSTEMLKLNNMMIERAQTGNYVPAKIRSVKNGVSRI